eukprot:TRINITY_DN1997_c0_g4_i3.p1 TRINITY_DN1997_c0_g4~~TRINITY_DN1997_c0_g4_i3.p1  ORF type:complete len:417 (+),score=59.93 TRINITY_DN1997_c0_g4_i3:45-1295(+)
MRVLLAAYLLLALLQTAKAQCNSAAFTQCISEHTTTPPYNNTCATSSGFTGEALCACQAQYGTCAKKHNCASSCITEMATSNCAATWCDVTNVSKPMRFNTVYRFTKEITYIQLEQYLLATLSPIIDSAWISITYITDVTVSTPAPTAPTGITQQQLDEGCPTIHFKSDCEKDTLGYCKWSGNVCVPSGKKVPTPDTPPPGPVVPPSEDIRVVLCTQLGKADMTQCGLSPLCAVSNNECIPNPNGDPLSAATFCSRISNADMCTSAMGACKWKGSKCTAAGSTRRTSSVLAGGPWEAEVQIEIQKTNSDVYVNTGFQPAFALQMDTAVASSDLAQYGATLHRKTMFEAADSTPPESGSSGSSSGASSSDSGSGSGSSSGMSIGVIIGIIAGAVVGVALLVGNCRSPAPRDLHRYGG